MPFPKLVLSAALLLLPFSPVFSQTPPTAASNMLAQAKLDPGAYLLVRIDTDDLRKQLLEHRAAEIRVYLQYQKIEATVQVEKEDIRITALKDNQIEEAATYLNSIVYWECNRDGNAATLRPTDKILSSELDEIRDLSAEIITNRASNHATKVYILKSPQKDQIFIGVPRQNNTDNLRLFVSNTTLPVANKVHVTFQLVDNSMSPEEAQKKGPPPESALYDNANNNANEPHFLLQKKVIMSEADITRAQMNYDIGSQPSVVFRLNTSGTVAFAKATQENTGKRFAIVLNNKVLSAPVIRERISSGSGMITGNFTIAEAMNLANSINTERLPVKLEILEERVVGYGQSPN
jgi:preprotein translocase subunit SecD